MGKTHKEQKALSRKIENAKQHITIGAQYHHYKGAGKIYTVLGLGFIEADNELCVIYKADYEEQLTFLRPLSIWLEKVEWEGKTVDRFTIVN